MFNVKIKLKIFFLKTNTKSVLKFVTKYAHTFIIKQYANSSDKISRLNANLGKNIKAFT